MVRVVCGLSATIATFAPTSALSSVDLPAFGLPRIETNPEWKPGDRVTPLFALSWLSGPTPAYDMLGGPVDGLARQYAVFSADSVVQNPDEIGDLEAATLACAGLTSWSAPGSARPYRDVQVTWP